MSLSYSNYTPPFNTSTAGLKFLHVTSPLIGPRIKLNGPKIKLTGPKIKLTGPKIKLTGPKIKLTGPKIKLTHPRINSARAEIPARLLTYGKEKTNLNKKHEVCVKI